MMEAPESKKGPLRHVALCGGESPLSQPPLLQVVKDIIVFAEAVHIYAGWPEIKLKCCSGRQITRVRFICEGSFVSMLNINEIQEIIPHRPPFLLVDKITEIEMGKRAVGIKNVTVNEPFFVGHFPGYPVMPGVLITEALAQVGAVAILGVEANKGKIGFLAGLDGFRFRGQVVPGDTLVLEVEITRLKGSIGKGQATAKVEGKVVASGEIMFALS